MIIVINNEWLKNKLAKKTAIPFPIELILVVAGTIISSSMELEKNWGIIEIGDIPTGFPEAKVPDFSLFRSLITDCFTIAMVSYTVSVSMGLIFAQKYNYEIDFNQELLAMGAGNIVSSFFHCIPFSASLSRSMIQAAVGGKTQIASIISCALLTIVLLWIGPFFEVLPRVRFFNLYTNFWLNSLTNFVYIFLVSPCEYYCCLPEGVIDASYAVCVFL